MVRPIALPDPDAVGGGARRGGAGGRLVGGLPLAQITSSTGLAAAVLALAGLVLILRLPPRRRRQASVASVAALAVAVPDIKNVPPEVNLHKVAAWAMVSRAILNLDETITKE